MTTAPRATGTVNTGTPLLSIENMSVNYGAIQAVRDLSVVVYEGEVVTLIGANGAGKTTTLRAVSRLLKPVAGRISFMGRDITRLPADEAVKLGIAQSPEGRQVLARQSVQDNLELGGYTRSSAEVKTDIDRMYGRAPQPNGRHLVGRRTADARHRPRPDEPPQIAAAG
jgi:branched-chain amino acid transport system ATP-binding protein